MRKFTSGMVVLLICVGLIAGLCIGCGSSKQGVSEDGAKSKSKKVPKGMKELTLSDLKLDGFGVFTTNSAINPFETEPVYYKVMNNSKYDNFFKDAAIIKGTIMVAEKMADAIAAKEPVQKELIVFIVKTLPMAIIKTKKLIKTGADLTKQVKNDFDGMQARKIPDVTKGITESIDNIKKAAEKLPGLIKKLK